MSISRRALFGLGALAVCGKARGQEPGFTDAEEIALGGQFAREHEKSVVLLDTPCLPLP